MKGSADKKRHVSSANSLVAPAAIAASLAAASSAASESAVANAFPKPMIEAKTGGASAPVAKAFKIPARLSSTTPKGSSVSMTTKAGLSANSLINAASSSSSKKASSAAKNANAAPNEKKAPSHDAINGAVSQESGNDGKSADSRNTNHNRGQLDIIDGSIPMPPGGKHKRLDPNKGPGMPLDNKDSFCGRLFHYVTGGSHPTNMSGTHVPGIRMDGATEGEYPPGMFAQKGRALKAFVNCFAGYFNTMGGSIPPCPGDCPPKGVNVNENSNKSNPLKKSPYEYPWSIRAGFLPENIEAFDLMEDSKASKNKSAKAKSTLNSKSINGAKTDAGTKSAPQQKPGAEEARSGEASRRNPAPLYTVTNVKADAAPASRSAPSNASLASNDADDSSSAAGLPDQKRSLWRELQQQRRSEQQLRRRGQNDDNVNQNCAAEENSFHDVHRSPSSTAPLEGASNLVLQYRNQIAERLSRTSMTSTTNDLSRRHQDLRIRRNNSDTRYISGSKGIPLRNKGTSSSLTLDPGAFAPSISPSPAFRRPSEWIPAAASGML